MRLTRNDLAGAARHALWVALAPWTWIVLKGKITSFGMDSAHAYWNVWRTGPYSAAPGTQDAFNYSPAFAHVIYPPTLLPWPAFLVAWCALLAGTLLWLLWPLAGRWRWLVFLYVVPPALAIGNIEALLALVAVLGSRYPAVWAFPLLTKVTPGLGPLWFAVRREWRNTLIACLATVVVVAASFAISPALWEQWVHFMSTTHTPSTQNHYPPLAIRLVAALMVVVWGARTNRYGALAVGMLLAMPLWSAGVLLLLAAAPRLRLQSLAAQVKDRPEPRDTRTRQRSS